MVNNALVGSMANYYNWCGILARRRKGKETSPLQGEEGSPASPSVHEDGAADQAWIAENEPAPEPGAGSLIPGLPELPELPLPQLPSLQLQ